MIDWRQLINLVVDVFEGLKSLCLHTIDILAYEIDLGVAKLSIFSIVLGTGLLTWILYRAIK